MIFRRGGLTQIGKKEGFEKGSPVFEKVYDGRLTTAGMKSSGRGGRGGFN